MLHVYCTADDVVSEHTCLITFVDGCRAHSANTGELDDTHDAYSRLNVGRDEAACLARARYYFEWCENGRDQRIASTYVPTGAISIFPPEEVEEGESPTNTRTASLASPVAKRMAAIMQQRKSLGAPWPLPCDLTAHVGSRGTGGWSDRPVVVGSLVEWVDVLGFDEADMEACPVPCIILRLPRRPPRQCVEQLDMLLVPMGVKPPAAAVKPPWQKWAYFSMESGAIYPEMDSDEHMARFDLEISYRQRADLWLTYAPHAPEAVRSRPWRELAADDAGGGGDAWGPAGGTRVRAVGEDGWQGARGLVLYLQSNCVEERDGFVESLMQLVCVCVCVCVCGSSRACVSLSVSVSVSVPEAVSVSMSDRRVSLLMVQVGVDSLGACLNNMPYPDGLSQLDLLARYKFVIAFENSKYPDYVTERIFNAWVAGAVPLYAGSLPLPPSL